MVIVGGVAICIVLDLVYTWEQINVDRWSVISNEVVDSIDFCVRIGIAKVVDVPKCIRYFGMLHSCDPKEVSKVSPGSSLMGVVVG